MISIEKNLNKLTYLFFLLGILFSYFRGSNFLDADAYSVILSFTNYIDNNIYSPSRGAYGHPIPELIIGSVNFYFGSRLSNVFCFVLFYFSIYLIYYTFLNKYKNSSLFLLLVVSNSYLFFENTSSMDYSFALFLFSLGLFFLFRKKFYLASVIFGLTIASRANFLLFIYPILFVFFFYNLKNYNLYLFIKILTIVTTVGLIFYIPLFYINNFTLNFLDLPFLNNDHSGITDKWYGGPPINIKDLLPRFLYKIYLLIGIYSSFIIFLNLKKLSKIKIFSEENLYFFIIIFLNLTTFYFMPTKISIIHPFIFFIYILIFKYLTIKQISIIIFLNFFQWILIYNIIDIKYKFKDKCDPIEAVSASFNFSLGKGLLFDYFDPKKDKTECYSKHLGKYSENFKRSMPLNKKLENLNNQ